jgi:hypothetical protein
MNQRITKNARKARHTLLALSAAVLPVHAAALRRSTAPAQEVQPSGLFCNVNALDRAERARQTELSRRLLARRQKIVETDTGYELQFRAEDVAVTELAEWAALESRCCPFFDFHIDLEKEGRLTCLRLSGQEGIKAFIRSEFHLNPQTGAH